MIVSSKEEKNKGLEEAQNLKVLRDLLIATMESGLWRARGINYMRNKLGVTLARIFIHVKHFGHYLKSYKRLLNGFIEIMMTRFMFLNNSGCHRKNSLYEGNSYQANEIDCFLSRQALVVT